MSAHSIYFAGISTGGSAVRKVFPGWMELLGVDAELETVDIPAGSPASPYWDFVSRVKDDPSALGAVITAHKTSIYEHTEDLFTTITPISARFGEISVIYRDGDGLGGTIIEPDSIATTLYQMGGGTPFLGPDRDVVVYGAGGTAVSLIARLTAPSWPKDYRPRTLHLVDTSAERLEHARTLAAETERPLQVQVVQSTGTSRLDALGPLPQGSLIVNATGLGKDRPGSPIELPAPWPEAAHVWDLNYRGALVMLDDARAADPAQRLDVHDGWLLFINGWADSLATIIGSPIPDDQRATMDLLAQKVRSR
jgi:shikimate 5-dehydrogenase